MSIDIRRGLTLLDSFSDDRLRNAVEALWRLALDSDQWEALTLERPGSASFTLRGSLTSAEHQTLKIRLADAPLRKALVDETLQTMDSTLDLSSVLDLPYESRGETQQLLQLIDRLYQCGAPRLLGSFDDQRPRRADDRLTVVTRHGAWANGEGTITQLDEWRIELTSPSITLHVSDEYEYSNAFWKCEVTAAEGVELAPLLDACVEADLYVRVPNAR